MASLSHATASMYAAGMAPIPGTIVTADMHGPQHLGMPPMVMPTMAMPHMQDEAFTQAYLAMAGTMDPMMHPHQDMGYMPTGFMQHPVAAPSTTSATTPDTASATTRKTELVSDEVALSGSESADNLVLDGGTLLAWHDTLSSGSSKLFDANMKPLPVPQFSCNLDKGIKMIPMHGLVGHKKNHFQVSAVISTHGTPKFVRVQHNGNVSQLLIDSICVRLTGYKHESPTQAVALVQSSLSRVKEPLQPQVVTGSDKGESKVMFPRLHFTTTTANNMRKQSRPNPAQRYFAIRATLYAMCSNGQQVVLAEQSSDKFIIRANSPKAMFSENNIWAPAKHMGGVAYKGNVGINFSYVSEALVVGGNCRVTGEMYQPSDKRVKKDIEELDISAEMDAVNKISVYNYKLKESWAQKANRMDSRNECGVLAQETQAVIPEAIKNTGSTIDLDDGTKVEDLLLVKKDRLLTTLLASVQHMAARNDMLRARVCAAEARAAEKKAAQKNMWTQAAVAGGVLAGLAMVL